MQNTHAIDVPQVLGQLVKHAPLVAVFLFIFWAGHKKLWYWGPGVRAHFEELKAERDEWKKLAFALLRKNGITLPENTGPGAVADLVKRDPAQ